MKVTILAVALSASAVLTQSIAAAEPPKRIAKILSRGDGSSQASAYKVRSVADEYAIIKHLGLETKQQALIVGNRAYDKLTVVDPATGAEREIWFDISSFYGAF
jgi:hypothetical protein